MLIVNFEPKNNLQLINSQIPSKPLLTFNTVKKNKNVNINQ